jgi:hypothetical protein
MTFSFYFSFVLDLSTWSLFSICDTLGFLCFLQGLSTLTFEKLQQNEKKNTTISRGVFFCWMFIIDSRIMQAHSTTIYLTSNIIWGYKSLTIISFNRWMIWFLIPAYPLIEIWYPSVGYFPNILFKPNFRT